MSRKPKIDYFDRFKTECERWITQLELTDWNIHILSEELPEAYSGCYAITNTELASKTAWIRYNKNNRDHAKLDFFAKHEVVHVMLGRFSELAGERYVTEKELIETEEGLVNLLCKLIK